MDRSPTLREAEDAADPRTQRDLAAEAQFLARFDPLAMLEAEYAAVLAQSRSPPPTTTTTTTSDDSDDEDHSDMENDGAGDDRSAYAALPTSPSSSCGREGDDGFYQPLGDDSDCEDDEEGRARGERDDEADDQREASGAGDAEHNTAGAPQLLETATRSAIMQSMQRLALAPPPWAKDASLSDDDLVAMVQRRMQR